MRSGSFDTASVLTGLSVSAGVHLSLILAYVLTGYLHGAGLFGKDAPAIDERIVVEARLVQLGKEFDPKRLPDRKVPRLQTAPPDSIAVSKDPNDKKPSEDKQRPPDPTEDLLTRLGDRAQTFAEVAEEREREGDPEGVEDGSSRAKAGDAYAGKLYAFFRRGWTVPTTISDEERAKLRAEIDIVIGSDLTLQSFDLRRSSGNALFDQSVTDNLQRILSEKMQLPAPPTEVAGDFVGPRVGLRFHGRHAQ